MSLLINVLDYTTTKKYWLGHIERAEGDRQSQTKLLGPGIKVRPKVLNL